MNSISPMKETIIDFHSQGNWKGVLQMLSGEEQEHFYDQLYLWIKPSEDDLKFISQELFALNVSSLFSIGCGTGLLEWLIQNYTGLEVFGIEVDRQWWESAYAPPSFIPLQYADENIPLELPSHAGIMFCYFNNESAFNYYMRTYLGKILIVIGPEHGMAKHTYPKPFDPQLLKYGWELSSSKEIQQTKDHVAIYIRRDIK